MQSCGGKLNIMWHAFIFEAKSIQPYILAGGRLRHIAGASAIVHDLCRVADGTALKTCLQEAGLMSARFLRCAGGSFTFVVQGDQAGVLSASISKFRALWSLSVQLQAPGLSFVDSDASGASVRDAVDKARDAIGGRRGYPGHALPAATPPILRAQRTGAAAVALSPLDDEVLDTSLEAKEKRRRLLMTEGGGEALIDRFVSNSKPSEWPSDMEKDFPFAGEDRTIALFHADGNRMGEIVQALAQALAGESDEKYIDTFRRFSENVEQAIQNAAQTASAGLLEKTGRQMRYPARPIVCAGDDITIILRADLAVEFAQRFMVAFELECENVIPKDFRDTLTIVTPTGSHPLPRLTACGGLVFAQANQPFLQVSALAESACKFAKTQAKQTLAPERWQTVPGCLTIHRLTSALIEEYDTILREELTTEAGLCLTANPYLTSPSSGETSGLAALDSLKSLARVMKDSSVGNGIWRQITSQLHGSEAEALKSFNRIDERAAKGPDVKRTWKAFRAKLEQLFNEIGRDVAAQGLFMHGKTPFPDAVTLAELDRKTGSSSRANENAGEAA